MSKIINATFHEGQCGTLYTKKAYQYDRGVVLRISGIALPEQYEVHFSDKEENGVSAGITVSGSDVPIPDAYFMTGEYIYAWIFIPDNSRGGSSEYHIVIPITPRPTVVEVVSIGSEVVAHLGDDEEEHTLIFDRK